MTRNMLLNTAIVLGIAILGVLGYKLSPKFRQDADVTLPRIVCNPGIQECVAKFPEGGQLVLSIEPSPIRPLQTLSLSVVLSEINAQKVEVDFDGSEMNMGYNRAVLEGSGDRFSGQAILPVCVSGAMEWVATVLITADNRHVAVPFHFMVTGR